MIRATAPPAPPRGDSRGRLLPRRRARRRGLAPDHGAPRWARPDPPEDAPARETPPAARAPGEGQRPRPAQAPVATHRPRLLVVDDERDIREALADLLAEELDADVDTASDGVEALEMALRGRAYDLCFVDERMPRLRGSDLLREMRARGLARRAILMSAYAEGSIGRELARAAGAEDFLRKPLDTPSLVRLARAHLASLGAEPAPSGG